MHFTVVRSLHKFLVHFLVDYSPVTKVAMFVLSYPCSVAAAALLYYVVEKPARAALVDGLRSVRRRRTGKVIIASRNGASAW